MKTKSESSCFNKIPKELRTIVYHFLDAISLIRLSRASKLNQTEINNDIVLVEKYEKARRDSCAEILRSLATEEKVSYKFKSNTLDILTPQRVITEVAEEKVKRNLRDSLSKAKSKKTSTEPASRESSKKTSTEPASREKSKKTLCEQISKEKSKRNLNENRSKSFNVKAKQAQFNAYRHLSLEDRKKLRAEQEEYLSKQNKNSDFENLFAVIPSQK